MMWRHDQHLSDADLILLLEDGPEEARARRCRQHLARCEDCRTRLRQLQTPLREYFSARRRILDEIVPQPESARHRLRGALARAAADGQVRAKPSLWRLSATFAGVALLLVSVAGGISWYSSHARSGRLAATGAVPDPRLTPGSSGPASRADVCASDSTMGPATIDRRLALTVFRAHGIKRPQPLAYELDHLVPRELGGLTAPNNLWPQAYEGTVWDANAKDALEERLVRMTCSGEISLRNAQAEIARDWVAAYRKHFRTELPLVEHAAFRKDQPWE